MKALCERLQEVNEAGTYRMNCSVDELRAAASQLVFVLFEAHLGSVKGKGEFLAAIAQAIKAPEWFGSNWDALADALNDLSWSNTSGQPAPGYVLLLSNSGETLGLNTTEYAIAAEIFTEAVYFWKSQDKPFWVFLC